MDQTMTTFLHSFSKSCVLPTCQTVSGAECYHLLFMTPYRVGLGCPRTDEKTQASRLVTRTSWGLLGPHSGCTCSKLLLPTPSVKRARLTPSNCPFSVCGGCLSAVPPRLPPGLFSAELSLSPTRSSPLLSPPPVAHPRFFIIFIQGGTRLLSLGIRRKDG